MKVNRVDMLALGIDRWSIQPTTAFRGDDADAVTEVLLAAGGMGFFSPMERRNTAKEQTRHG